jgi:predicted nucleic acid-binding protein
MARVIDTDIFSFLLKKDTRAQIYRQHLDGHLLFLSFMTIAEVERWAMLHNWGQNKINILQQSLRRYVIKHSDIDICQTWALIMTESKRNGLNVSISDAWIAATAVSLQLPLVTNNAKDFVKISGLTVMTEVQS